MERDHLNGLMGVYTMVNGMKIKCTALDNFVILIMNSMRVNSLKVTEMVKEN